MTTLSHRDLAFDASLYNLDGNQYIILDVTDGGTRCYRVGESTRNIRALSTVDAVLYDGDVLDPVVDDIGRIVLVHNWAGNRESFLPREWLDDPVWKLTRVAPHVPNTGSDDND